MNKHGHEHCSHREKQQDTPAATDKSAGHGCCSNKSQPAAAVTTSDHAHHDHGAHHHHAHTTADEPAGHNCCANESQPATAAVTDHCSQSKRQAAGASCRNSRPGFTCLISSSGSSENAWSLIAAMIRNVIPDYKEVSSGIVKKVIVCLGEGFTLRS